MNAPKPATFTFPLDRNEHGETTVSIVYPDGSTTPPHAIRKAGRPDGVLHFGWMNLLGTPMPEDASTAFDCMVRMWEESFGGSAS